MITKHLFGLVECYECQGTCYYKDLSFNPIFLDIIGMFIVISIPLTIAFYIYIKTKLQELKEK